MKDILYKDNNKNIRVVVDDTYKGVRYIITDNKIHPCAYVMCSEDFLKRHVGDYNDICEIITHGGITYTGKVSDLLGLENYQGFCFGWDYGHFSDWAGYRDDAENIAMSAKKWTVDEIIAQCKDVIDQYLKMLDKDAEIQGDNRQTLTREILENLGFTSNFPGDEGIQTMVMKSNDPKKKWKIYVDLQSPGRSYAYNQNPKRRYEGGIMTLEELQMVVDLCRLPVEV
jgi:hypothetical protein